MLKPLFALIIIFSGTYFLQFSAYAQSAAGQVENPYTIHQESDYTVSPGKLYQVLLDEKQFSRVSTFTGFPPKSAKIDSTVGGTFSLFGGHIIGRILELVPNRRIVEAWRVVDWPPGIYSIARFEFIPWGTGTRLVFDHTGFPVNLKEHLAEGWQQHYWEPLTKYFQQ